MVSPSSLLLILLACSSTIGLSQVIFSENIGSPSGTTAITSYTGWQNNGVLTFSGSGDVRNTSPSSGYGGASGNGNVFLTNSVGTTFIISGINTSSYLSSTLQLSFGVYKSTTAENGSNLIVEVSSDGSSYSALSFTALPTGGGTATWYYRTASGTIPSTSTLYIRFRQNSSTPQFRIDDVSLSSVATGTYTSAQSGNWNTGSTWVGGAVPSSGADVTIASTHVVTVDASVLPNNITVSSGATLTITSAGQLGNSSTSVQNVTVDGTFTIPGTTGSLSPWIKITNLSIDNGAVFTNSTTSMSSSAIAISNFTVNAGGTYNHDAISSVSTAATSDFPGTSSRSLSGTSTVNISKWGQTGNAPLSPLPAVPYGTLTINITGQSYTGAWNQAGAITSVSTLNIQGTGTKDFRLFGNSSGGTLNISGDLNVSGGTLALINSSSAGSASATINVAGNLTVSSSGVLDMTGSNASVTSGTSNLNISGNLSVSGSGSIKRSQAVTSNIAFNKSSGSQTISTTSSGINANDIVWKIGTGASTNTLQMLSDFPVSSGSTITVYGNATLDCSTYVASGGTLTVSSNATLKSGNTSGIAASAASGSVQTTTRTFSSSATYVFNGSSNQVTGNFYTIASTANNLTTLEIANTGTSPSNVVTLSQTGLTVTTLKLTSGVFSVGSGNTINIVATTGAVTNNGGNMDGTSAGGTVNFNGAGTINGTTATTFYNVTINTGAVTIPTGATIPTINGTLQINGGNLTNPPKYGSSSTLYYNTSYGRYVEWNYSGIGTIGTDAGYPNNVTVNTGTLDVYNGASGVARACAGTLTVNNGGTFSGNSMNAVLTIGKDVVVNNGGTLNMSNMTQYMQVNGNVTYAGALTLSASSGGDIKLTGNWTKNSTGTFTQNSRAVFFNGTTTQTVSVTGGGTETFSYLIVTNTATLQLSSSPATNVTVNTSNGLTLSSTATNTIDLNGQTMTLSGGGNLSLSSGARSVMSSSGTGSFVISSAVTSVTSGGTLSFATSVIVKLSYGMNFGNGGISTINGTLQINSGGWVDTYAPYYASTSTLNYNSGGAYTTGQEWYENTFGNSTGVPQDVTITTSGTAVSFNATSYPREMRGNLTISNGTSLTLSPSSGGDLYIKGNWDDAGTFNPNCRMVKFNGTTSDQTITRTGGGTETYNFMVVEKTGYKLKLGTSTDVKLQTSTCSTNTNYLTIIYGDIDLQSRTLYFEGPTSYGGTGATFMWLNVQNGNRTITSSTGPAVVDVKSTYANKTLYLVDGGGSGRLIFDADITLKDASGEIDFGSGNLATVKGVFQVDNGGAATGNSAHYDVGSILRFTNGNDYQVTVADKTWADGTSGDIGIPYHLEITTSSSSTDLVITASNIADHLIRGNLTITSSTLQLSTGASGNLYIMGNWTRTNGSFSPNSKRVIFQGSSAQVITVNTASETFYELEINNSSGLTLASGNANVSNALYLTSGVVTTGSNEVTVTNSASSAVMNHKTDPTAGGYTSSSYVYGNLRRSVVNSTSYDFPVGMASSYELANLTFSNIASITDVVAKFTGPGANGTLGSCAINGTLIINMLDGGYWTLTPTGSTTGVKYDVTLIETGFTNFTYASYTLGVIKRENSSFNWSGTDFGSDGFHNNSTQWVNGTFTIAKAVRTQVPTFSDYALGNSYGTPLPIELATFTVSPLGHDALLNWSTWAELSTDYFGVERSLDGKAFAQIGVADAAGFSTLPSDYSFIDQGVTELGAERVYYRLRVVNADQTFEHSAVRWIDLISSEEDALLVYPNPFTDAISISWNAGDRETTDIRVADVSGKIVEEAVLNASAGTNFYTFNNLSSLPAGVYFLHFSSGRNSFVKKLVRQ